MAYQVCGQSFVVGAYASDMKRSLDLLQKASTAMRDQIVDDVHIGNTFAEMIQQVSSTLMPRMRRFVGQPPTGAAASRAHSHSPMIAQSPIASHGLPMPTSHPQSGIASWNGNGFSMPSLMNDDNNYHNFTNGTFINNIEVYDPNGSNVTVMPPPNYFSMDNNDGMINNFSGMGMAGEYPDTGDWLAPDLAGLMNLATGQMHNEVSATQIGPAINGIDILDHIRNDVEMPMQHSHGHGQNQHYMLHPNHQTWGGS